MADTKRWAVRAFDFIDKINRTTGLRDAHCLISREMEWYGFNQVLSLARTKSSESVLMNTWSEAHTKGFVERQYYLHDPFQAELEKRLSMLSYDDVREHKAFNKLEQEIDDYSTQFGDEHGYLVPSLSMSGDLGLFVASGRYNPELPKVGELALEMTTTYAQMALDRIERSKEPKNGRVKPLSHREREVVSWAAVGKSDNEISEILNISSHTVTYHVRNAKKKLDAYSRTYMVVKAIQHNQINP